MPFSLSPLAAVFSHMVFLASGYCPSTWKPCSPPVPDWSSSPETACSELVCCDPWGGAISVQLSSLLGAILCD